MNLALSTLVPISVRFLLLSQITAVFSSLNENAYFVTHFMGKIRYIGSVKAIDSEPFMRVRQRLELQSSEDWTVVGRNASKLIYMALSRYLQFPGA